MTTQIDTAGCATDEALARLWARDLGAAEEASLREHLANCAGCADRAQRLSARNDTWVGRLRSVGAPPAGAGPGAAGLAPDAVPGYRIEGELARGGQGVVHRAIQLATRRSVALKVLRDGLLASDAARRRFQREIELIAELRHPNLLTVYDAGVTRDGRAYFAMELVEGRPLGRWIDETPAGEGGRDRAAIRAVLAVFVRICDAVSYAHQRGVIHRDLKPSNVLIDAGGEPRVVDFGLARASGGESVDLTAAEQIAGTLPYMSPEQARGLADAVDVRSDVYSLGVMLYESLARSYPYPIEPDTVATLRHIAETPPKPLRDSLDRGRAIDDELETIVLKALAKERERRYQSAGELARDLERYLAGEPIEAKRDSAAYILRKALRRHRGIVRVSAAFVVTVTGLAIALAVLYARQSHLRSVAEQRYQQVRELARSFIFEFDPKIRRLPGSAEARQLIVEKGLAYLDVLSRDAPDDPALLREIAAAYTSIGDIQSDATTSNLGRTAKAVESYRKAEAILAHLDSGERATDSRLANALVPVRLRIVDRLLDLCERDAAHDLCRTALAESERLVARFPDDEGCLDSHGDALERMGNCLAALGDRAGSDEHYRRALEIGERLAAAHPQDRGHQRDLAVGYTKRAKGLFSTGDRAGALELYRRYVAITDGLLSGSPEDVLSLRDSGVGYQWIGILELESQRPGAAIEPLRRSRELLERLVSGDPANQSAALSLTATLTRLVEAEIAAGELDAAPETAARNVEVSRGMAVRSPESPDANRQYGVSLYKMFELHQALATSPSVEPAVRQQRRDDACAWLEKSRDWFVELERQGRLGPADAAIPSELTKELDAYRRKTAAPGASDAPGE